MHNVRAYTFYFSAVLTFMSVAYTTLNTVSARQCRHLTNNFKFGHRSRDKSRDGKVLSLLEFGSVRVLPNITVRSVWVLSRGVYPCLPMATNAP